MSLVTKTKLDYNNGENEVPKGSYRISASGVGKYFSQTRQFWGELMLGETGFTGSTASVLGTCVHYTAECVANHGDVKQADEKEIERYIEQFENPENVAYDQEIDCDIIRYQWPLMARVLKEDYLNSNKPTSSEDFLYKEMLPGIGAGGSCDAIDGIVNSKGKIEFGTIVDYKTSSAKTLPTSIKFDYRLQLLTYAWLYTQRGHHVDKIRIVYITRNDTGRISEKTGKPLKDYPTKVEVLTEAITSEDLQYIEGILQLISESIDAWNNYPACRHLLSQDQRLKQA